MNTPAGVCRFCGCTEHDACVIDVPMYLGAPGIDSRMLARGCSWVDVGRRVCSVCAPAAKAQGRSLRTLRRAGYAITPAWLRAHHLGFVVGWFGVSARSRYGRNPFPARPFIPREAWDSGWRAGAAARRIYAQQFGEITNEPRKAALLANMPRGRRAGA